MHNSLSEAKKPVVQTHKPILMKNDKLCMHDKAFKRFLSCGLENKRYIYTNTTCCANNQQYLN